MHNLRYQLDTAGQMIGDQICGKGSGLQSRNWRFNDNGIVSDAREKEPDLRVVVARLERRLAIREKQITALLRHLEPVNRKEQPSPQVDRPLVNHAAPDPGQDYQTMVERIQEAVERTVPIKSTLIVISKGDEKLCKHNGRTSWHFPQNRQGTYAGYYPADSEGAIKHLEQLRSSGGQFLVVPATAFWWFTHYSEFFVHLKKHYPTFLKDEKTCRIFDLRGRMASEPAKTTNVESLCYANLVRQIAEVAASLLPSDSKVAVVSHGDPKLLKLGVGEGFHLPATALGEYAGHHPVDSAEAIGQIKAARERGMQFVIFPQTTLWWLEYYKGLHEFLYSDCRLLLMQPHVCAIFELRG